MDHSTPPMDPDMKVIPKDRLNSPKEAGNKKFSELVMYKKIVNVLMSKIGPCLVTSTIIAISCPFKFVSINYFKNEFEDTDTIRNVRAVKWEILRQ